MHRGKKLVHIDGKPHFYVGCTVSENADVLSLTERRPWTTTSPFTLQRKLKLRRMDWGCFISTSHLHRKHNNSLVCIAKHTQRAWVDLAVAPRQISVWGDYWQHHLWWVHDCHTVYYVHPSLHICTVWARLNTQRQRLCLLLEQREALGSKHNPFSEKGESWWP